MISSFGQKLRREYIKQIVSVDGIGLGRVMFIKANGNEPEFIVEMFDTNKMITTKSVKKL